MAPTELGPSGSERVKTMERPQKTTYPPTSLRADGITHVGLKVTDAQRSGQFYQEVLGLEYEPPDESTGRPSLLASYVLRPDVMRE